MGDLKIKKEDIIRALSTVQEPDLKQDLITLNMIKDIELGVGEVRFTVVLTTPACPLKERIRKECTDAIHTHVDADLSVVIDMTADVTSSRMGGTLLPNVKNIIAIASGKGGVGKSTITANLAMALKQSGRSKHSGFNSSRARGRYISSTSRTTRLCCGKVASAATMPVSKLAPVRLPPTSPTVSSNSRSSAAVEVFPLVPETRMIRRPQLNWASAAGLSAKITRPETVAPSPRPNAREDAAAARPAAVAIESGTAMI